MNKRITEEQVLKTLGIPDFRHMTKEKIIQFVSVLPYMDPEVAKKALEQFPEFKDLMGTAVIEYKSIIIDMVESNSESQKSVYSICNDILDSLRCELQKENLSIDDRSQIEDKMIEVARIIADKDSENKKFLIKSMIIVGAVVSGIIGIAATILGSNIDIDNNYKEAV